MRAFRLLLVVAVSFSALLVLAPSAGAASSTCKSLKTLQRKLDAVDLTGQRFKASQFSDVGDAFHSAAKKAKSNVKSALNTIGDVYDAIGDGGITGLSSLGSAKYGSASRTFSQALVNCA